LRWLLPRMPSYSHCRFDRDLGCWRDCHYVRRRERGRIAFCGRAAELREDEACNTGCWRSARYNRRRLAQGHRTELAAFGVSPIASRPGESRLAERTPAVRPWWQGLLLMPPEPTFAISIEGRLESARHGILWVGFTSSRPAAPGRAFLPEWAIPLSYRQLWMILSLMGTQARKMIR